MFDVKPGDCHNTTTRLLYNIQELLKEKQDLALKPVNTTPTQKSKKDKPDRKALIAKAKALGVHGKLVTFSTEKLLSEIAKAEVE